VQGIKAPYLRIYVGQVVVIVVVTARPQCDAVMELPRRRCYNDSGGSARHDENGARVDAVIVLGHGQHDQRALENTFRKPDEKIEALPLAVIAKKDKLRVELTVYRKGSYHSQQQCRIILQPRIIH